MAEESKKYSGLRDLVLSKLKTVECIPIQFSEGNKELVESLAFQGVFYAKILPFAEKTYLFQKFGQLLKDGDGKINGAFNDDVVTVAWIIMKGVVDREGQPFFNEDDVINFCGRFMILAYDMAWAVCDANDLSSKSKQNTVGNSEGTEQLSKSSELPLASERLLEG